LNYVCWIYIYMNSTTPKRYSETETFHSNWKNETPIETELTTLAATAIKTSFNLQNPEMQEWWTKKEASWMLQSGIFDSIIDGTDTQTCCPRILFLLATVWYKTCDHSYMQYMSCDPVGMFNPACQSVWLKPKNAFNWSHVVNLFHG
jgi:hypothetical protein